VAAAAAATLRDAPGLSDVFEPAGHKDVLFVFELPGPWARYRCDHQAEQLALLGATADVVQLDDVDLTATVDHYDCFVLNRVPWSEEVATFVDLARERTVLYDTDDLNFDPTLERHFAFLDGWPEEDRRRQAVRFESYRRTLESCDGAIVSTQPLAEQAARVVGRVGVAHNAVSEEMVAHADEALAAERPPAATTIAYLSGTRTHDRDFLEAADAVLAALQADRKLRLLIVGKLQLDARFDRFAKRIERMPVQPWDTLPRLVRTRVDVNLAPLERDNPVTECKSCVKYLEAALVGVPTIASPRPDFVRAIEDGGNGFLADDATAWHERLQALIGSAELRSDVGAAAYEDVRQNHTTRASAQHLRHALDVRMTA
jgi:O-antigen biosynthesis protein